MLPLFERHTITRQFRAVEPDVALAGFNQMFPFGFQSAPVEIHGRLVRFHSAHPVLIQVKPTFGGSCVHEIAAPRRPVKSIKGAARTALRGIYVARSVYLA